MILTKVVDTRKIIFVVPIYDFLDTVVLTQLQWTDNITPIISYDTPKGYAYITAFIALLIEYTFTKEDNIFIALDQIQGLLPGGYDEDGIMAEVFKECVQESTKLLQPIKHTYNHETDTIQIDATPKGIQVTVNKPIPRPKLTILRGVTYGLSTPSR